MEEIQFIESMQTLEIRDGDILVVRINIDLDQKTYVNLAEVVKSKIPDRMKDTKVFVLTPGVDLGVIRKEAA